MEADFVSLGDEHFSLKIAVPSDDLLAEYGPRFDLSGRVVSIEFAGQEWLAEPGLADEFNMRPTPPPGYNEAQPGMPFLKPGVGLLARLSDWRYFFAARYPVLKQAEVRVLEHGPQRLAIAQDFQSDLGWAYHYEKHYVVDTENAVLAIHYTINNTGQRAFHFDQYNHNTFRLGGDSWRMESALSLSGATEAGFSLDGSTLGPEQSGDSEVPPTFFAAAQELEAADNIIALVNPKKGASIVIEGDFPAYRFQLFANSEVVCPEVFIRSELAPGQSIHWTRLYGFGAVEQ